MNIPRIIANEEMHVGDDGRWPISVPTRLLEETKYHPTGRYDIIAGDWVKREPHEHAYKFASYEEIAITYYDMTIALIRVRRAPPSPL